MNITRIESRPSKISDKAFDIYVDFDGSRGDEGVDCLLDSLKRDINSILVLDKKEVGAFVVIDAQSFTGFCWDCMIVITTII